LKITVPPALALPKVYHAKVAQADLHVFCAEERLKNNAANEDKIGQWSSRWKQDRTMIARELLASSEDCYQTRIYSYVYWRNHSI